MKLSITTISINALDTEYVYAECHNKPFMLSVVMLSVVMLNVVARVIASANHLSRQVW
jgi:hypothetical protein